MSKDVKVPQAGEILGTNYLIEKELGRGGFGVVFKARHIDIDRVVAIKVLLATYARKDPRAKERFKREATIAASLGYPNSLRVFDYGETEEGVFYIVMEYIEGSDLGKILRNEGTLPVPRAIHITRQILHALTEAHERGIVHRDIKPDNVMLVTLRYDPDFVKVMDFGIAKMVDAGEEITQHGITLGTPRYMPIEQLKGAHLGPATDLYATGLVLYEMLVGRPAFTGDTAVDTAVAVMEGGSVRVPPDAEVPAPIAEIIAKACARESEDRYQSTQTFLDAINALDPALLDIAPSEREHFVAAQKRELIEPASATSALRIEAGRLGFNQDFEDAIGTEAISTEEVLQAVAPARALSPVDRLVPTGPIAVLPEPPAPPPTPAPAETTMAWAPMAGPFPPAPARAPKPPMLLVVLNAATLLVAFVTLLATI